MTLYISGKGGIEDSISQPSGSTYKELYAKQQKRIKGFVVKEKDKSHDVRREEEDDDKISTNRDQSTNEDKH